METVNFNQNVKINILKNGMEINKEEIIKLYGETIEKELLEADYINKPFLDKIATGFADDKVDRILLMVEFKRADRL